MSVSIAQGVVAVAPKQIVAGTNVTVDETTETITINAAAGGSSATSGSSTIDFGAAPGTNFIMAEVLGQTEIAADSVVKCYMTATSTATHNVYEHAIVPLVLTAGNIVPTVGFTIYASSDLRLTGTFTVYWEWI
jgi:hypothetical protein